MSDPEVNVLNVGDGACTVLRPWPERRPGRTVILDCGTRRASPTKAAKILMNHLCGSLTDVEAIVISHFDLDHWGGLANLDRVPNPPQDLPSIPLYYPAMPSQVQSSLLAMMGPLSRTGSAALDLQQALTKVCSPGQSPKLCPLDNASRPLNLAGEEFQIVWPPRTIERKQYRKIYTAVDNVKRLADDLATAGYPDLKGHLDRANRATRSLPEGPQPTTAGPLDKEAPDQPDPHGDVVLEPEATDVWIPEEARPLIGNIPNSWHERYRTTLRSIRAANNDLSLVLASQRGRLIAFGDIGGKALSAALSIANSKQRSLPDSYDVILAPHHGSHRYLQGMPSAKYCISQGGTDLHPKWQINHPPHGPTDSHSKKCWHTHTDGDFQSR